MATTSRRATKSKQDVSRWRSEEEDMFSAFILSAREERKQNHRASTKNEPYDSFEDDEWKVGNEYIQQMEEEFADKPPLQEALDNKMQVEEATTAALPPAPTPEELQKLEDERIQKVERRISDLKDNLVQLKDYKSKLFKLLKLIQQQQKEQLQLQQAQQALQQTMPEMTTPVTPLSVQSTSSTHSYDSPYGLKATYNYHHHHSNNNDATQQQSQPQQQQQAQYYSYGYR